MKIVGVPRVSALGKVGPEEMAKRVLAELGVDGEMMEVGNEDIGEDEAKIYSEARRIFGNKEKVVFVGGDHSVSYPVFRAFGELNEDAFLIVFDAHADCMPPMKEPTHEEWLRGVVENCGLSGDRIVLIGARKIEDVEMRFLREKGIKVFSEIYDLEAVGDYITERAMGKDVYVSVDVDVLDPAFAPGVNCAEPNGLSSKELFYLLRRVFKVKGMKALDVVEAVPSRDEKYDYRTVKVAAGIVDLFLKS
jgi:arginase family enzyme